MKLHEIILHCQSCACPSCKFRRRKIRFETVSRATYDPDRRLVEIPAEPEAAAPSLPEPEVCSVVEGHPETPGFVLAETLEPATVDA